MAGSSTPSSKGVIVTGAIVALVIAVIAFLVGDRRHETPIVTNSGTDGHPSADPSSFSAQNGTTASASANADAPNAPPPALDRERADAMRTKIHALPPAPPSLKNVGENFPVMPHSADSNAELARYIKDKIHADYMPLAKTCYESALVKTPTLGGKLVMKFRIVGDRRVGGVVDSADVDPETTIQGEEFLQCVKESLMAVSFDAPPNDGHVDVTYPIFFSPDDGGEADH